MEKSITTSMDHRNKHAKREETSDIFIANCLINEVANQSRKVFLQRLEHIRNIRINLLRAFSLFPTTEADWAAIERFYAIVEKGNFGEADFPSSELRSNAKVFGVYIPNHLYEWFANTSLPTINKQITLYSATVYHFFMGDDRPKNLFSPLYNEIKRIIEKYYESTDSELEDAYEAAARDYYHSLVPPFLSIDSFSDRVLKAHRSGCHDDITIRTAYFSRDDWNHHVLHKTTRYILWKYFDDAKGPNPKEDKYNEIVNIPEHHLENLYEDELKRAESDEATWTRWLLTFRSYPISKSYIFSLFNEDSEVGYVYIAKVGISNHYKIGFTANSDIDKRISAHQTSSHERLEKIGAFPVSSKRTEKTIHKIFSHRKVRGEWFELSDEEVENLLSSEWRRNNNIF